MLEVRVVFAGAVDGFGKVEEEKREEGEGRMGDEGRWANVTSSLMSKGDKEVDSGFEVDEAGSMSGGEVATSTWSVVVDPSSFVASAEGSFVS